MSAATADVSVTVVAIGSRSHCVCIWLWCRVRQHSRHHRRRCDDVGGHGCRVLAILEMKKRADDWGFTSAVHEQLVCLCLAMLPLPPAILR